MKKLGKLTLKELKNQIPAMNNIEQKIILAGSGGIDDNDCYFEALTTLGSWLNCNSYTYNQWCLMYAEKFGNNALVDALNGGGVSYGNAIDFLDDYFLVNTNSSITIGNSGETLGFLNVGGSGNTHALLHSISGNVVTYYDQMHIMLHIPGILPQQLMLIVKMTA